MWSLDVFAWPYEGRETFEDNCNTLSHSKKGPSHIADVRWVEREERDEGAAYDWVGLVG